MNCNPTRKETIGTTAEYTRVKPYWAFHQEVCQKSVVSELSHHGCTRQRVLGPQLGGGISLPHPWLRYLQFLIALPIHDRTAVRCFRDHASFTLQVHVHCHIKVTRTSFQKTSSVLFGRTSHSNKLTNLRLHHSCPVDSKNSGYDRGFQA